MVETEMAQDSCCLLAPQLVTIKFRNDIIKTSKRYFQATTEDTDQFHNWKQVRKPLPSYLLSSKEYCLDADAKKTS